MDDNEAAGDEALRLDLNSITVDGIDAGFFSIDVTLAKNSRLPYALDGFGYFLNHMVPAGGQACSPFRDARKAAARRGARCRRLSNEDRTGLPNRSMPFPDSPVKASLRNPPWP